MAQSDNSKKDDGLVQSFIVGFIRGSHGVSGKFNFESASGYYEHFEDMSEVTLRNSKTGDSRVFKVESVEIGSFSSFMKLEGINSPEDVKKYNHWEIVVPRDNASFLDEDEWYVEDLKGCSLYYEGKGGLNIVVGTVTDVMEGGSGDLLEVKLAEDCDFLDESIRFNSDGKVRTVLIPMNGEAGFIGDVDVRKKKIQLMHLWILE